MRADVTALPAWAGEGAQRLTLGPLVRVNPQPAFLLIHLARLLGFGFYAFRGFSLVGWKAVSLLNKFAKSSCPGLLPGLHMLTI